MLIRTADTGRHVERMLEKRDRRRRLAQRGRQAGLVASVNAALIVIATGPILATSIEFVGESSSMTEYQHISTRSGPNEPSLHASL